MTLSRPYSLAMPSPTEVTYPTSATSILLSYPSSWAFRILLISSVFIILAYPFTRVCRRAFRAPDTDPS